MRILLLGPLAIEDSAGRRLIEGPRKQALLGRLMVSANRVVSTDALLDAMWGDRAPAAGVLHTHVSQLRRVVGTQRLIRRGDGYRLTVAADEVDADQFEADLAVCDQNLSAGDATGAIDAADRALGRWRGDPLGTLGSRSWALSFVARLDELRSTTLDRAIEARLRANLPGEAAVLAESAVAEAPLRERFWVELMIARYRQGRQAEALEAHEQLRTRLREELGLDPSDWAQAVERAILQQHPLLRTAAAFDAIALQTPSSAASRPSPKTDRSLRLPATLERAGHEVFVGRKRELDVVLQAVRAADQPRARAVLISGEPGIGKTRLIAQAARAALDDGVLVVYGAGSETDRLPFLAFVQIFAQLAATCPGAVEPRAVPLGPLLKPLGTDSPDAVRVDDVLAWHEMVDAAVAVLTDAAAATGRPVLVIIDDAHWADEGALTLLRELGEAAHHVTLVAAYRHTDLAEGHGLESVIAALGRLTDSANLRLDGLSSAELTNLVEQYVQASGSMIDPVAVASRLGDDTAGNPFYAAQLLRATAEGGPLPRVAADLPRPLRAVLVDRIERLGEDVAQFLRHAAVLGRHFETALAAELAGLGNDPQSALALAERAARGGVLHDRGGSFEFVHDLISQALLDTMGASRRQALNLQAARALSAAPARRSSAAQVAGHWLAAGTAAAGSHPDALEWMTRAGWESLSALLPDTAVGWFEHARAVASESASGDRSHVRVLLALGEARRRGNRADWREPLHTLAQRARAVDDRAMLVAAMRGLIRGTLGPLERGGTDVGALYRALNGADVAEPAVRAQQLAGLTAQLTRPSTVDERMALFEKALRSARECGSGAVLAEVVCASIHEVIAPQSLHRLVEITGEALAADLPPTMRLRALRARLVTVSAGDASAIDATLEELQALAAEHADPALRWLVGVHCGWRAAVSGDVERGWRALEIAERDGPAVVGPDAQVLTGLYELVLRRHDGSLAELRPRFSKWSADGPLVELFGSAVAFFDLEAGASDAARAALVEARSPRFDTPHQWEWLPTHLYWAEFATRLGDLDAAALLYPRLAPFHDQVDGGMALAFHGSVAQALGGLATLLGRFDVAEARLAEAEQMHEVYPAPFHLARTYLAQAELAHTRGAPDRAAERLRRGREVVERYRCTGLSGRLAAGEATLRV